MSKPRFIVPEKVFLLTRRTSHRFFLLNPDEQRIVWSIYWYVTAVLAAELGLELHAVQILSNHMHEVVTDTRGQLPRFLQQRNRLFANALKVHLGWRGAVFDRGGASYVDLCGPKAILEKIAYVLANVVEAGLALRPEDWPGVTHAAADIGTRTIRVDRPAIYFDPDNPRWPAVAEIAITVPRALERVFGETTRARIVASVEAAVVKARDAARKAGRLVKSIAEIFATKHTVRATSYEEAGTRNPTFAAAGDLEEAVRAVRERRAFYQAYRDALQHVREGLAGVVFPRGTWRMVQEFGFRPSTT